MPESSDSLAAFAERIRGPPGHVTVFGRHVDADLRSFLDRFDVELTEASLPLPPDASYLTVRRGDSFLGSIPADGFDDLVDPPRTLPWSPASRASAYRQLTELLRETAFRASDRRHLLATAREFEDRAWRVGRGRLHVGFQSVSALRDQLPVYERLAAVTDLSVYVYGKPDWLPPESLDVTVRTEPGGELGDYWLMAFDGGGGDGDEDAACALLARSADHGEFTGAWTYDPSITRDLVAYLDETYGAGQEGTGPD